MGWTTLKRLGHGCCGWVDLVEDLDAEEKMFASKTCPYQKSESLRKEYDILMRLPYSPFLVRCLGQHISFHKDHNMFLYHLKLEYAPNGTLEDVMGTTMPENAVKRCTRLILNGLSFLHQQSIVHCDLKPANILISADCNLKIADLGLASSPYHPESLLHPKYKFRGTPAYMSPESISSGQISTALDIWSLGCIVSQMLTGQVPWNYLTDDKTFMRELVMGSRMPLIPQNLSEEGKDFLMKCFCRDPTQRWTAEMLLRHPFIDQRLPPCARLMAAPGFESRPTLYATPSSSRIRTS